MKYIHYIAAVIALGFLVSRAEASLNPIVINFTATQQSLNGAENGAIAGTTNITATTTNSTTIQRFTTTNTVINNAKILKMLANSFNTNFPATAVLKLSDEGDLLVVVGTNIILNASSVVSIGSPSPTAATGTLTEIVKKTPTLNSKIQRAIYTGSTALDGFAYDDSALSTADGKHTTFTVQGAETFRVSQTSSLINGVESDLITYIITFTGATKGTVSDKSAVIRGTVTASVTSTNI